MLENRRKMLLPLLKFFVTVDEMPSVTVFHKTIEIFSTVCKIFPNVVRGVEFFFICRQLLLDQYYIKFPSHLVYAMGFYRSFIILCLPLQAKIIRALSSQPRSGWSFSIGKQIQ